MTKISSEVFTNAIPRLIEIGWLERIPLDHKDLQQAHREPDGRVTGDCHGTERNGTERKGRKELRTFDRTYDRLFLSDGGEEATDWGVVKERCLAVLRTIRKVRAWSDFDPLSRPTEGFCAKLIPAVVCVSHGILPKDWLLGVINVMLDDPKRKDKPTAWLGKVLSERAREDHGVDWDSYRRAIKIPDGLFKEKSDA